MVKNGDFILIEYTGYDAKGSVFDSTKGDIGKNMHGKDGPILIIYGKDLLVPGMQEALTTMHKGDSKRLQLPFEKAFGKRRRELVKTMPLSEFYNSEINPVPGIVVNLDTPQGRLMGVVKSVNSGRVLVDFNHPLAEQNVSYDLVLSDVIEKTQEKVTVLLTDLQLKGTGKVEKDTVTIELSKKNENLAQKKSYVEMLIKSLFPEELKTVTINEVD